MHSYAGKKRFSSIPEPGEPGECWGLCCHALPEHPGGLPHADRPPARGGPSNKYGGKKSFLKNQAFKHFIF